MPRRPRLIAPLVYWGLYTTVVVSCATATKQTAYIAPSYATIVAEPEESPDGVHQSIYMVNHSTVPVVITSFQLHDCENVANPCEAKHMRILLSPGQRALVATIGPIDRDRAYNYRYSWTWAAAQ
jgi:hypothetical protein